MNPLLPMKLSASFNESESELRKFFFEKSHDGKPAQDLSDASRDEVESRKQVEDNFKAGLSFCKALEKPNMKKSPKLKRLEIATRNCYAEFLNSVKRVSEAKQQIEIILEMVKEETESSKEQLFYNQISIAKCRLLVQIMDERWEKNCEIYLIEMATCLRYAECLTIEGKFDDAIQQLNNVAQLADAARAKNCRVAFNVEKCALLITKIEQLKQANSHNGSFKMA